MNLTIKFSESVPVDIVCEGHAFKGEPGKDIVCAGISSLINNLYVGLKFILNKEIGVEIKDGFFHMDLSNVIFDKNEASKVNFMLETTLKSLELLGEEYRVKVDIRRYNV